MDGIASATIKAIRAMEHRNAMDKCIGEYYSRDPCRSIVQAGEERLSISESPPDKVAVLIGEILYQVRSALDHLYFELVRRHMSPVSRKWERGCYFPLLVDLPKGITAYPLSVDDFKIESLKWIPKEAFTFIETLQPYRRGNPRPSDLLWYLVKLSNIDKHRYLHTTVTLASRRETLLTDGGFTSTVIGLPVSSGKTIEPLWHDPSLCSDQRVVAKQREIVPMVVLDEPEIGHPEALEVDRIIGELPTMLFGYIISNFRYLLTLKGPSDLKGGVSSPSSGRVSVP